MSWGSIVVGRRKALTMGAVALGAPLATAMAIAPRSAAAHDGTSASAFVDVPTYVQQRNLSCEYASAVIAMGAFGSWVSEWSFDEMVGWSANPHWGYRGDINGWWGNTTDYGVYAEPLVGPLANFGFWGQVFYGQGDPWQLEAFLNDGVPVIVWLGLWGDQSYYEYAEDGTPYKLTPGYHVVVAYGYDESGVYVSDPATGSYNSYAWGDFLWMWNVLDGMSLAVAPV